MDVIYNFEPLYWMFFAFILIGFDYFELLCIGSPFFSALAYIHFGCFGLSLICLFHWYIHKYIHAYMHKYIDKYRHTSIHIWIHTEKKIIIIIIIIIITRGLRSFYSPSPLALRARRCFAPYAAYSVVLWIFSKLFGSPPPMTSTRPIWLGTIIVFNSIEKTSIFQPTHDEFNCSFVWLN